MKPKRDEESGRYPAYAWPGGYPIVYTFADEECCCPACANGENGSIAHANRPDCPDDEQWRMVSMVVHYEGESVVCAHCNAIVESAYGLVGG